MGIGLQRLVLPAVCPICLGRPPPAPNHLCDECARTLPHLPEPRCPGCGGALDGVLELCAECLETGPRPWHRAVAAMPFTGAARELIHRLKYRGHTYLAPVLARPMTADWQRLAAEPRPDAVTPVPMHWTRQLRRGYNQSALLAHHVARELGIPLMPCVRRRRKTAQQALLDFSGRQANMKDSFTVTGCPEAQGLRILVVDDVMTTGATMSAVAQVLMDSQAAAVDVLVTARG